MRSGWGRELVAEPNYIDARDWFAARIISIEGDFTERNSFPQRGRVLPGFQAKGGIINEGESVSANDPR